MLVLLTPPAPPPQPTNAAAPRTTSARIGFRILKTPPDTVERTPASFGFPIARGTAPEPHGAEAEDEARGAERERGALAAPLVGPKAICSLLYLIPRAGPVKGSDANGGCHPPPRQPAP